MFEEMIENLRTSVRATVLETVQDIVVENFPELLSYSDLKKLLGGIDDTTFGFMNQCSNLLNQNVVRE